MLNFEQMKEIIARKRYDNIKINNVFQQCELEGYDWFKEQCEEQEFETEEQFLEWLD